MSYRVHGEFLVDDANGRIVGVKNTDGSEFMFAFVIQMASAPATRAKATVTADMTLAKSDITVTAVNYGPEGNRISIVYVDPAAASQDLSVTVSGTAITVHLETDDQSAIVTTAADVVAEIAATAAAAALVVATAEDDGSGVVNALAVASLAGGANVTDAPLNSIVYSADGAHIYMKTDAYTWTEYVP